MAELVQGLGQCQRDGEADQAGGRKRLDHSRGEGIPLLQDQEHTCDPQQQHNDAGQGLEQPVKFLCQPLQMLLRAQQRHAKK
ncbi:hypothetical protein D3C78_1909000 [compost metagenome]